jgi:hypothetical protein
MPQEKLEPLKVSPETEREKPKEPVRIETEEQRERRKRLEDPTWYQEQP